MTTSVNIQAIKDIDALNWLKVHYPSIYTLLNNNRKNVFQHSLRAMNIGIKIAEEMNLSLASKDLIAKGLITHDIGKIYWPKPFFYKTDLNDQERDFIKYHSEAGYNILVAHNYYHAAADIALKHHEKINGQGYPFNLKGEELTTEIRVATVADCYEALTGYREYRSQIFSPEQALEIMLKDYKFYDPVVLDALTSLIKSKVKM